MIDDTIVRIIFLIVLMLSQQTDHKYIHCRKISHKTLSRAGRRSAGLGSDGGARTYTHAVGVRAYGVVCVPQTKRGGVGDGAICSVVVHRWFLTGRRYENYESVLVRFVSWACSLLHFLMKLYVLLPRAFRSPRFWFLKIRPLVS